MLKSSGIASASAKRCLCGNIITLPFCEGYVHCAECETLIATRDFDENIADVTSEKDLYGEQYWYSHQNELGYPDIVGRARADLYERCVDWLQTLLKYKRPPGKVLELGCAHAGFVALLNWAGFDATGLELSPRITAYARETFRVPVLTGALEHQQLEHGSFDAIVMFDVFEHLPNPRGTIELCLHLLKPDGILMIQTPSYPTGITYQQMVDSSHQFLAQIKNKQQEHLFLLSEGALDRFLNSVGAASIIREKAVFGFYDQYLVAGRHPLVIQPPDFVLESGPAPRLVQAILDGRRSFDELHDRWQDSENDRTARLQVIEKLAGEVAEAKADRDKLLESLDSSAGVDPGVHRQASEDLIHKWQTSEDDRAKRLAHIEDLSGQLQTSEDDRAERLKVINELSIKWQASEDDRAKRLAYIEDLSARLQTSEDDRAESLKVINELSIKWQASEDDRTKRLAYIEDLSARLQMSEQDRAQRQKVINEISVKWLASEEDRAKRLQVIEETSSLLKLSQGESAERLRETQALSVKLAKTEHELARQIRILDRQRQSKVLADLQNIELKRAISSFRGSRTGRLLKSLGVQHFQLDMRDPNPRKTRPSWVPARPLRAYSLPEFKREFIESRPDLADVQGYNKQMLDIFASLRPLSGKTLLDVGASPHGFALDHSLWLGTSEYCGIGLGIHEDIVVESEDGNAALLNMNADELELPTNCFDLIITLSTFEHFFHPDQVLRELYRVLKPGGAMLVNFQPIWTSAQGHHLHHKPDVTALLPPFSHLIWNKEEMQNNLQGLWPDSASMTLNEAVTWIYDSDEINRIPVNTLRTAFLNSPFKIQWMTPLTDEWTSEQEKVAQDAARSLSLPVGDLAIKGFSLLMVKN